MIDLNRFKITESVNAITRKLDFFTVEPSRFILTNFTTNHHIARARVADDINATHIGATPRIDCINNADGLIFLVGHGIGRCRTKGISERRVLFGNLTTDVIDKFGVIGRSDFKLLGNRFDKRLKTEHIACERHAA